MNNFKIMAPFVNIDQVKKLYNAGADQLYCGFVDKFSEKLWPIALQTINRRVRYQSFENYSELKKAVKRARIYSIPVYITFNCFYVPEQYPWLIKNINKLSELEGVSGIITADIGLILTLRKSGFKKKINLSIGATVLNSYSVDFYKRFGINRIILERQLSINEIKNIIIPSKNSNIEFEIFIFHTGCNFIDGFCHMIHCFDKYDHNIDSGGNNYFQGYKLPYNNFCDEYNKQIADKKYSLISVLDGKKAVNSKARFSKDELSVEGCNLCILYYLRYQKIYLKVIERGKERAGTVSRIKEACLMLKDKKMTFNKWKKISMDTFFNITSKKCNKKNCYFPEIYAGV